jgi:hypothetical protein
MLSFRALPLIPTGCCNAAVPLTHLPHACRRCKKACEERTPRRLELATGRTPPRWWLPSALNRMRVCGGTCLQAAQAAQAQLASMSLRSQTLPPVHFQQPTYSHPPPSYSAPPPPQQQHQPPQSQYGGWAQYGGGVQQPNYSQPPPPAYDPHTAPGAQPMYDPHTAPGAQPAPAYYHSPPTNTQYYQQPPPQQQQPYGYGGQSTYPQYQYPPQ